MRKLFLSRLGLSIIAPVAPRRGKFCHSLNALHAKFRMRALQLNGNLKVVTNLDLKKRVLKNLENVSHTTERCSHFNI